jgi:hypothetical protein
MLLFHPDKNIGCQTEATVKFQKLNNLEHCLPFSNPVYSDNVEEENALIGGIPNNKYNRYYNPYYNPNRNIKNTNQLSYYIIIDIELHPGTTLTPELKKGVKCKNKWNAVRKAYSEFTGHHYSMKPDYSLINTKLNINQTKKKYYNPNKYYNRNNYYPRNKYTRKKNRNNY